MNKEHQSFGKLFDNTRKWRRATRNPGETRSYTGVKGSFPNISWSAGRGGSGERDLFLLLKSYTFMINQSWGGGKGGFVRNEQRTPEFWKAF